MMQDGEENDFVVINELFTTAATYDAEIMGRKVLTHFIEQNCQGIYVTHLKELASVHPKVVSLRAMLNADRIQTFEIARSEAEESACAASVVNKYHLTYEQLKERL
jgi:DNA mismatch repair ATPase MutS